MPVELPSPPAPARPFLLSPNKVMPPGPKMPPSGSSLPPGVLLPALSTTEESVLASQAAKPIAKIEDIARACAILRDFISDPLPKMAGILCRRHKAFLWRRSAALPRDHRRGPGRFIGAIRALS